MEESGRRMPVQALLRLCTLEPGASRRRLISMWTQWGCAICGCAAAKWSAITGNQTIDSEDDGGKDCKHPLFFLALMPIAVSGAAKSNRKARLRQSDVCAYCGSTSKRNRVPTSTTGKRLAFSIGHATLAV